MTEPVLPAESVRDARMRRRNQAERRFKLYGQIAIGFAVSFLVALLISIGFRAVSAFSHHTLVVDLPVSELAEPESPGVTDLNLAVRANLLTTFPELAEDRVERVELFALVPRLAVLPLVQELQSDVPTGEAPLSVNLTMSDDVDLYLKNDIRSHRSTRVGQAGRLAQLSTGAYRLSDAGQDNFISFQDQLAATAAVDQDILIALSGALFELADTAGASLILNHLAGPVPELGEQGARPVTAIFLGSDSANRQLSTRQVAVLILMRDAGMIERRFNSSLFVNADSTYPELAGAAAAIVGSIFTMLVTALFAMPVGVFAAIYLEEFAQKSRLTNIIEVNINNLAAVPSIIFGLLGAAVFLNTFDLPRSIPLVGGLVLGLLVLPTIIIASRAALRSVPPSMREAALGLGASKSQAVFHHVLPRAAPGILTGAIIAMARALGETAPLLLIGMVAFVSDVPTSPSDEATVLPVLIYKWFSGSERAWEPMTAAIILILLTILIAMNLVAVLLRRRFERRW